MVSVLRSDKNVRDIPNLMELCRIDAVYFYFNTINCLEEIKCPTVSALGARSRKLSKVGQS
jgi:hypothetical protein